MAEKKQRPGEKVTLHHPKINKEIVRTRRQAELLKESGWVEGKLPAQTGKSGGN